MPAQPISTDQMQCSVAEAPTRIADNWNQVQAEVAEAARASDRDPQSVRIIGVSKYVDAAITKWLVDAGCYDLGENRPQLLGEKAGALTGPIRWHQIGHLQRNKVRRLLAVNPLVHSVDSERLLEAIDKEASVAGQRIDILIEINISGEDAKTGLPADQLEPVVERWMARQEETREEAGNESGSKLIGLMAMAGWGTEVEQAKAQFAGLRKLRDGLEAKTGLGFPELSMGMSGDYPAAVAEGATMVRIGSRLFEGIL